MIGWWSMRRRGGVEGVVCRRVLDSQLIQETTEGREATFILITVFIVVYPLLYSLLRRHPHCCLLSPRRAQPATMLPTSSHPLIGVGMEGGDLIPIH